jgi:hypothetical protein
VTEYAREKKVSPDTVIDSDELKGKSMDYVKKYIVSKKKGKGKEAS